jgi:hypothetical protein
MLGGGGGEQFGKGVYFADMASKSANYCFSSRDNNVGIMALSEVALGDGYACLHSKYMDKPPSGFHSTKGCGQTEPDPATAVLTEVRHRTQLVVPPLLVAEADDPDCTSLMMVLMVKPPMRRRE